MKAIIFLLLAIFVTSVIKKPLDNTPNNQNAFANSCKECQLIFGNYYCRYCPSDYACNNYCKNVKKCVGSDFILFTKFCTCFACN